MKLITSILIILSITFVTENLQADVKSRTQGDKNGYGYEFDDDPLNAGGFGVNDAVIKVRPKAARTTLIRPRTSFIPELLKSVEFL